MTTPTTPAPGVLLADRLFDAWANWNGIDSQFFDQCVLWFHSECFEDTTIDQYDRSFELLGCANNLRCPPGSLDAIWAAGFERFWLNHEDGTETRYVRGGHPEGPPQAIGACRLSSRPIPRLHPRPCRRGGPRPGRREGGK